MTIALLGNVPGRCHPLGSGGPNPYVMTVPAGGIPVGVTVIVMGWSGYPHGTPRQVASVTDSKGNAYTVRAVGDISAPLFLIDGLITTALAGGDSINLYMTLTDTILAVVAAWFTRCYFDKLAQITFAATTAATGGTITPVESGELILGVFGLYMQGGTTATPAIVTPGAGYTNQTGYGFGMDIPNLRADEPSQYSISSIGVDWESRNGTSADQTATATMNKPVTAGLTAAYIEFYANQVVGAV